MVLAYTDKENVSLNVGFYYMAKNNLETDKKEKGQAGEMFSNVGCSAGLFLTKRCA